MTRDVKAYYASFLDNGKDCDEVPRLGKVMESVKLSGRHPSCTLVDTERKRDGEMSHSTIR